MVTSGDPVPTSAHEKVGSVCLQLAQLMLIGSKMDTLPNTWLLSNQSDGLQRI